MMTWDEYQDLFAGDDEDEDGERNWEAESMEARYVSDEDQRWYQCDEDDPYIDPDIEYADTAWQRENPVDGFEC